MIPEDVKELRNKYEIQQQKLLQKYHEATFKGLPFEGFQACVKHCFESLPWQDRTAFDHYWRFPISQLELSIGSWKLFDIKKYENPHRRFKWDDAIVYTIVLYRNGRTQDVAFDAFDKSQLLGIGMTCFKQAIYDLRYMVVV